MSAPAIDPTLLPAVRSAQGALIGSIFSHPAFDKEGERMYGKLFYVFETTVASNEALEVAHLGDETDNATRAALETSEENNARVVEDIANGEGEILKLAKDKYADKLKGGEELEDVDLGEEVRAKAREVRDAAGRALGRAERGREDRSEVAA